MSASPAAAMTTAVEASSIAVAKTIAAADTTARDADSTRTDGAMSSKPGASMRAAAASCDIATAAVPPYADMSGSVVARFAIPVVAARMPTPTSAIAAPKATKPTAPAVSAGPTSAAPAARPAMAATSQTIATAAPGPADASSTPAPRATTDAASASICVADAAAPAPAALEATEVAVKSTAAAAPFPTMPVSDVASPLKLVTRLEIFPPATTAPTAPPSAVKAPTAACAPAGSVEKACCNASSGLAPWFIASAKVLTAFPAVSKAGMSDCRTEVPSSVSAVRAGMSEFPTSPMAVLKSACAWRDAMRFPLRSWYAWPASPYRALSVDVTSALRSCSVVHAASAALKASSFERPCSRAELNAACAALFVDRPAFQVSREAVLQLRASAMPPTTRPVLAVSCAASTRFSTGRASAKVANAPALMFVQAAKSCSDCAMRARLLAASVAVSVSPMSP